MDTNKIDYTMLMDKISEYAKNAGRASVRSMLLMYYVLRSRDTPASEKIMIYSAIAYIVLPIDLISAKRLPFIGWIDEVVSLTVAYQKIKRYITPEMEKQADTLLDKWFTTYTPYEEFE